MSIEVIFILFYFSTTPHFILFSPVEEKKEMTSTDYYSMTPFLPKSSHCVVDKTCLHPGWLTRHKSSPWVVDKT